MCFSQGGWGRPVYNAEALRDKCQRGVSHHIAWAWHPPLQGQWTRCKRCDWRSGGGLRNLRCVTRHVSQFSYENRQARDKHRGNSIKIGISHRPRAARSRHDRNRVGCGQLACLLSRLQRRARCGRRCAFPHAWACICDGQ